MARPRTPQDLDPILVALSAAPGGIDVDGLMPFTPGLSRRTLQRRLAEWSSQGLIRAEGVGKARRYFAPDARGRNRLSVEPTPPAQVAARAAEDLPLSSEGRSIRESVQRPAFVRTPVGYRREFLDEYEPNVTRYLSEPVARHLGEIGRTPNGERPAGAYARDILGRLLIDLSWASSRLEGNTYSLLDTEQLIRNGSVPAGKDIKETQMILNHKAAIELLVESVSETGMDRFTILNLHALLADNLLDDPRAAGRLRVIAVGVGGSVYLPSATPQLIEEQFEQLLRKAAAIQDPFEQSFFAMVQLPYLQPFVDVNKRTSRLAANIPLIHRNLVPLSFVDVPEKAYIDGLLGVYEHNRVELLRDVFVWAYERSCLRYKTVRDSLPEPDPFRLAHRQSLIHVIGAIVRDGLAPNATNVAALAEGVVDAQDLERFTVLALRELDTLHEGNIVRFRLRPSEFHRWRASLAASTPTH